MAESKKVGILEAEFRERVVDDLTKISDNQTVMTTCFDKLDKKLDLHIQKMDYELGGIQKMDEEQNTLIAEHIAGVETLKQMSATHDAKDEARFLQLEAPFRWVKTTLKLIAIVTPIVGATYGALVALGVIK